MEQNEVTQEQVTETVEQVEAPEVEAVTQAPEAAAPTPDTIQKKVDTDKPLTADNIAERAKAAKASAKKSPLAMTETPPPGEAERGPDGKFLPKGKKDAAKAGEGAEATAEEGADGATGKEAQAAAYKLQNPKFTALGKEYDLPKWAQEAIKDDASEKEIKQIFSKTQAFDHVQARAKETHEKYVDLSKGHNELVGSIHDLRGIYADAVQSGNLLRLDDFFATLQIPPSVVLQYALARVQYEELPPEQRAFLDASTANQRRLQDLSKQNQELQQGSVSAESKALAVQMDYALTKPEVASVAQAFDSQPGRKPGDFREQVRKHGEYTFWKSGGTSILPPDQAVAETMAMFGLSGAPQAQPAAPVAAVPPAQAAAPQAPAAPAVVPAAHQSVPVIPSVAGRAGASPTKAKPRSIEDLKKLGQSMASG